MADTVTIPVIARTVAMPRHAVVVRITHWINTLSFLGLVVSGVGILLAHPRFYWGETGGVGTQSIFDLPLPFMLGGPSGWGRSLHFESAWLSILNGLIYVASGLTSRHFRNGLAPEYNALQRGAYMSVIFVFFPLMIWTGLAMSPAVVSVFPGLVTTLGGHQSARTIHFFCAIVLVIFVFVHIAMVWREGFMKRMGSMIRGGM